NVSSWRDIVAVTAGDWHTIGLKLDGTVTTVGNNRYGQCNVSSWRGIVAVKAGYLHTVGLKRDGTVTAVGNDKHNQC
ncbi:chromosome condensation regulator, partial [Bacillus pseudomycoides]